MPPRVPSAIDRNRPTSCAKYSRSQGTAVNCSRWVASCRHTHMPKSALGTFSACWAA